MAPHRTNPTRADAQHNRERILEAAHDAFADSGDASLNSIAKRAGVGAGTLYRHFPTREALILAVYRHDVQQLADSVPTCSPSMSRSMRCGCGSSGWPTTCGSSTAWRGAARGRRAGRGQRDLRTGHRRRRPAAGSVRGRRASSGTGWTPPTCCSSWGSSGAPGPGQTAGPRRPAARSCYRRVPGRGVAAHASDHARTRAQERARGRQPEVVDLTGRRPPDHA